EPCRCFSFEQLRGWGFGDRVTSRLRHIPDVGGLGPDHLRPYDLARSGLLTSAQTPPRLRIRGRRRRETTRYRGIDHVARLTLLHLSAERLPLPVAGDVGRNRRRDTPGLVVRRMLKPDQQGVVKRSRPELRSERQRSRPILTRDQLLDRPREALV